MLGALITLVLRTHTSALVTLFTASTIMPALLYASTVLLYVFTARRHRAPAGHFSLGRYEIPVIAGALIWLAYELIILIGPAEFRDAQYYVLGALGVGLLVYIGQWLLEPGAMRTEEGAHGADALSRAGGPGRGRYPGRAVNILAIDQGTSATKALVLGPGNEVLGSAEEPVHPASTPDGGVEQDPEELYRSVLGAGTRALAAARAPVARDGAGQPGRDRAGLGPPLRTGADPGHRLAGSAVRGHLRRAFPAQPAAWPPSPGCRSTRTSPRRR